MEKGIKGRQELVVSQQQSAIVMGSGTLPVFATPAMIALVEKAAWKSVAAELEDGQSTVGTKMEVEHISATPVGMKVWAETELVEIDRRRLVFKVKVYDEAGLIGEGTHERFIVGERRFLEKAEGKKAVKLAD